MPEEIEVETKELRETIEELREERAQETRDSDWLRYISLTTAFLAVIAAVAALKAGGLVNEAILSKNEAVLKQAQASDQWAYYQGAGIKANTAQYFADLVAGNPTQAAQFAKYKTDVHKYEGRKATSEKDARGFEKERDIAGEEADGLLKKHEMFALSVTFTQVAIALSAIAALTKRKHVWYMSTVVGLLGLYFFGVGWIALSPATHKSETKAESATPPGKVNAAPGGSEKNSKEKPDTNAE